MLLQMKEAVMLGGSCSAVLEVGSLKSALGGSAAELQLQELPPEARQRGWALDTTKMTAAPGECACVAASWCKWCRWCNRGIGHGESIKKLVPATTSGVDPLHPSSSMQSDRFRHPCVLVAPRPSCMIAFTMPIMRYAHIVCPPCYAAA
jgi:hypothetical protein